MNQYEKNIIKAAKKLLDIINSGGIFLGSKELEIAVNKLEISLKNGSKING